MSHAIGLAYGDLALDVRCADRGHLVWLGEFLTPHFEPRAADGGDADAVVELTIDAEAFSTLERRGPLDGCGAVDGFALDNSVIPVRPWRAEPGTQTFLEEGQKVFLAFRGRCIRLLAAPGNPGARTVLMRVARELAMHRGQRDGGVFLHAAAVAFGDRAIAIAGPKAAGKTTLLLHLLGEPGAAFVANDRVLARRDGEGAAIAGMPTILTVRPRTLDLLPELGDRLRRSGYDHRATLAELATGAAPPGRPWRDGRWGLSPAQLCALAGVAPRRSARARALVFPAVTGEPGGADLVPLAAAAAATRLADALFGIRTWRKSSELFALAAAGAGQAPDADLLLARCEELTRAVPCFECRLGDEAYADPAERSRLVERLLA